MIEAHAVDAWTRTSDRASAVYRDAIIAGGFAAPLFLWLAGLALVLSAASAARREGSRTAGMDLVCRRGLEIFILAFLFRLQAFIVTPGSHPVTLFRVDILNIMGLAIAAAGIVWGLAPSPRAAAVAYSALAALVAILAPIVRTTGAVDALPLWIQWYVRPAGEHTTFTVFPWGGFVFAGAALGIVLAYTRREVEGFVHACAASAGVLVVAIGFYTASLPTLFRGSSFWTSSPSYFSIRVGLLMLALAGLYALERMGRVVRPALGPLEYLGRRSLFVYWIHVELVYGYATWPLHQRLPLWGTAVAYVMFTTLLYGAAMFVDAIGTSSVRRRTVAAG